MTSVSSIKKKLSSTLSINTDLNPLPSRSFQSLSRVGPYMLLETLGKGTTSCVKLGMHIETKMKVAVKILNKQQITDMNIAQKVEREIAILKLLKHDSILELYDVFETEFEL